MPLCDQQAKFRERHERTGCRPSRRLRAEAAGGFRQVLGRTRTAPGIYRAAVPALNAAGVAGTAGVEAEASRRRPAV